MTTKQSKSVHRRGNRINVWKDSQGELGPGVRVTVDAQAHCIRERSLNKRREFLVGKSNHQSESLVQKSQNTGRVRLRTAPFDIMRLAISRRSLLRVLRDKVACSTSFPSVFFIV